MAMSSAHRLAVVLIDRLASVAARASAPTRSTPGSPWRKPRSEASDQVMVCVSAVALIRLLFPFPTFPQGTRRSAPRNCRQHSLVCSHVSIPPAPFVRPGDSTARPLRARQVRVEPRGRAALILASRPGRWARLPGAVPTADRRPRRPPMAGGGLPDGATASLAGLRPGDGCLLRPEEPGWAAVLAQSRPGRGISDSRRQAWPYAPTQPEDR